MTRVTAAVLRHRSGRFQIESLELDEPREREVRVRIAGTGICHTDLSTRDQLLPFPLPAVLGHEGAGVVDAIGPGVTRVKPGDHVVLSFSSCGECEACQGARPSYCAKSAPLNFSGRRGNGGRGVFSDRAAQPVTGSFFGQSSFASQVIAGERNLVKIRADVPLELMGPLGCGLQTGAGAVLNVLRPAAASSIVVFGAGAVGMAAIMAARICGCTTIVAVDINDERLALARELGATHSVNAQREDLAAAIASISRAGLQYSIETTGHAALVRQAVEALRPGGSCVMLGTAARAAEVSLNLMFMLNGRSLRGVMEGDSVPEVFIPQLIELWRHGCFPFDRLVQFFDLAQIEQAVEAVEQGRVIKAILRPSA